MVKKQEYTVCMDESGKFEEKEDKARFLGGCIYKGNDFPEEEKRLEAIMQEIAKDVTEQMKALYPGDFREVVFPGSFHMSDIKLKNNRGILERVQDREQQLKIKSLILERVIQYLTGNLKQETEKNQVIVNTLKKRQGSYECFMMIDPSGKAKSFEANSIWDRFNMTKLQNPGNLYVRLATLTVSKMVYYFMRPDMKKISFMLASRKPYVEGADARLVRDLYKFDENGKRTYYSQINESTFVTYLQNQIYEGREVLETTPKEVAFQVKELEYSDNGSTSPFMYLSDMICLYLQRTLYRMGDYESFQADGQVLNRVEQSLGQKGLPANIWIYEPMDIEWKRALDALAEGELAEALVYLYNIQNDNKSAAGVYYQKHWMPLAMRWIQEKYEDDKNGTGIYSAKTFEEKLPSFVGRVEELIAAKDNEKAKWITDNLIKIMRAKEIQDGSLWYRLYDVMLRYYNHCGDLKGTEYCLKMLNKYCASVSDDTFMKSVSRAFQWYFNRFSYHKIVEIGTRTVEFGEKKIQLTQEQIRLLQSVMEGFGTNPDSSPAVQSRALGVMYSSIGQALAFLGKAEEADSHFVKAIAEFKEGSRDYEQTLNYRLHNFIESRDEEKYLNYAEKLFKNGVSGIPLKENKVLFTFEDLNKVSYNLFLWLKALTVFGWDEKRFKRSVSSMAKELFKELNNQELKKHPWTLILKYLYLYGKRTGCVSEDILQGIFNKLMEIDKDLQKRIKQKKWTALETVNGTALLDILEEGEGSEFLSHFAEFMSLRDEDIWPDMDTKDLSKMKEYLKNKMTYTYM